jgi:predicted CoA-binding protein
MAKVAESIADFLEQKRIAVAGVSRHKHQPANVIYRRLRDSGFEVIPINPNADEVEGDRCFPSLSAIGEAPDGVMVVTTPGVAEIVVRDCAAAGVSRVWMHRSFGSGSVSEAAVRFCKDNGISVIEGACPMMYCAPVDVAHRCMRWFLGVTKKLPT